MPRSPHRLTWLFLTVVAPATVTLVWLGFRLLQQDRDLYASRAVERQDAAADAVVRALNARIAGIERDLMSGQPIAGAAVIVKRDGAIEPTPPGALAWNPPLTPLREAQSSAFRDADVLEARGSLEQALAFSTRHARASDDATRAAALLRVIRISSNLGDIDSAVRACDELARETGIAFDAMPADLLARRQKIDLLRTHRPTADVTPELAALTSDFAAGRWRLPSDAWEHVAQSLVTDLGASSRDWSAQRTFSMALEVLLQTDVRDSRRLLVVEGTALTAVIRGTERSWTAALFMPATIGGWLRAAQNESSSLASVALQDDSNSLIIGAPNLRDQRLVRRTAADTGLPWAVVVGPVPLATEDLRRREVLAVLALGSIVLLLVGGSALLWRGVQRELAVARLQGDFVAAVSHEFRTPLTSLRHTIELLQEDDELPQGQRRSFYEVLGRNTERLHRLVESLLDVGRMEEGRHPYRLEPVNPAALARCVAEEFGREAAARGCVIRLQVAPDIPPSVLADGDALGHAMWNLLDNAVKYSPGRSEVELRVRPERGAVAIEVIDRGLGIPAHEREGIFDKFVRGEHARTHGIKGTGVGLAIVSHVVRAHGGTIQVDSEEGKGSTFRLLLPVAS